MLDVACGTGLVSMRMADAGGRGGEVVGVDISERMVEAARRIGADRGIGNAGFLRSGAEQLLFADGSFDAAVCGLGLMYVPGAGGRLARDAPRWSARRPRRRGGVGRQAECGWAEIFPITDARVASDVCPMFFHLGTGDMLARRFEAAGFAGVRWQRLATTLAYARPRRPWRRCSRAAR